MAIRVQAEAVSTVRPFCLSSAMTSKVSQCRPGLPRPSLYRSEPQALCRAASSLGRWQDNQRVSSPSDEIFAINPASTTRPRPTGVPASGGLSGLLLRSNGWEAISV